jgi:hypothetical protein
LFVAGPQGILGEAEFRSIPRTNKAGDTLVLAAESVPGKGHFSGKYSG